MVASTSDGELFIVEGFEMKQYIENAFASSNGAATTTGDEENEIINITVIKEFSKGFFVGSDNGFMSMWVRSEENNSTSGK
jgi:hypothetical protein